MEGWKFGSEPKSPEQGWQALWVKGQMVHTFSFVEHTQPPLQQLDSTMGSVEATKDHTQRRGMYPNKIVLICPSDCRTPTREKPLEVWREGVASPKLSPSSRGGQCDFSWHPLFHIVGGYLFPSKEQPWLLACTPALCQVPLVGTHLADLGLK